MDGVLRGCSEETNLLKTMCSLYLKPRRQLDGCDVEATEVVAVEQMNAGTTTQQLMTPRLHVLNQISATNRFML